MTYYLAIDIGASSGRHIISWLENRQLKYEEVYRFKNGIHKVNNAFCWDLKRLFDEIKTGLQKCKEIERVPSYIGIDTWGVDFVLLDKDERLLGNTVSYRDQRTKGLDKDVFSRIAEMDLYNHTGIQNQQFNTIFQLYAVKKQNPEYISNAKSFLMIPDYFNYLLTGIKSNEYTNATTTGLVNAMTKKWDNELINKLELGYEMFHDIRPAGTILGKFTKDLTEELGYSATVILPATHDTGSAVLAVPYANEAIYISSGTWSLMGVVNDIPILNEDSRKNNFTNEGGFNYKFRYLKNIMGLWMIQSVKDEYKEYSFDELSSMAKECHDFPSRVNVLDNAFLAPQSMIKAVQDFCMLSKQSIPKTVGEVCAVIYQSLALCYKNTAKEISKLSNKEYKTINIVGGGCKDTYLCQLTANISEKKVIAGPTEATAIGNILAQMIATKEVADVKTAGEIIKNSFNYKIYESEDLS